jgi:transcriptional regulator with PAS, ATPase and Fis domain
LLLKIAITVVTVLTLLVLYFIAEINQRSSSQPPGNWCHDVLDHTTSIISIKDLSGRFILLNQAYEQAFNIREENVKGKTVFEIFEKDVANATAIQTWKSSGSSNK